MLFLVDPSVKDTSGSKRLEWVIDATIAYPEGRPLDLFAIIFGHRPPCRTVIHYRRYAVCDIPRGSEQLLRWLYERWTEKEALLDYYYKTGKFPVSCDVMQSDNTATQNIVDTRSMKAVDELSHRLVGQHQSNPGCDEKMSRTKQEEGMILEGAESKEVLKGETSNKTVVVSNDDYKYSVKHTSSFRPIPVNDAWVLTLHAVFLLSSYFHLRMFAWAVGVVYDILF